MRLAKHNDRSKNEIDSIQSGEYEFPYHYIPAEGACPNFARNWTFSASWLACKKNLSDWLQKSGRETAKAVHLDIGCGDGGVVNALARDSHLKNYRFLGIDYDEVAVSWANAFKNERTSFVAGDISELKPGDYLVKTASLIEVYEHIPPVECAEFLKNIHRLLEPGAQLFVTVPSKNKTINPKHYRHFTRPEIIDEFSQYFELVESYGFEKHTIFSKLYSKFMASSFYYIELRLLNNWLIEGYRKKRLNDKGCGRLGFVFKVKSGV